MGWGERSGGIGYVCVEIGWMRAVRGCVPSWAMETVQGSGSAISTCLFVVVVVVVVVGWDGDESASFTCLSPPPLPPPPPPRGTRTREGQ